jgi:hypothetical protein
VLVCHPLLLILELLELQKEQVALMHPPRRKGLNGLITRGTVRHAHADAILTNIRMVRTEASSVQTPAADSLLHECWLVSF